MGKRGSEAGSPASQPAVAGTPAAGSVDPFEAGGAGRWLAIAFVGFSAIGLLLYQPALSGPFVSDDFGYLTSPYTRALDLTSLAAMFDPAGDARLYTGNYAPIHLLLHATERHWFGSDVVGFHVVNVLVHALNGALLVMLLHASGVARRLALLGGALFIVHPANVEAVAWISQLKTCGALALSLSALLLLERRPVLASLSFALALLTKASAAWALPMAIALHWLRRRASGPDAPSRSWVPLAAWAVIFGSYALPQLESFRHIGSVEVEAFSDPGVHLRSVAAVGARYVVMAATSYGVAAFQEPPPAVSWLDPWWLAALPLGGVLGFRLVASLVRRREEGAWWVAAAASFAPVSQVFPFLIPVADRYLYLILPFLIGGALLWGIELARADRRSAGPVLRAAGWMAIASLLLLFAARSHERAKLWRNETLLLVDAAAHYPEGGTAYYLRARRFAQEGDTEAAVTALRAAADRGMDRFDAIQRDPGFAPLRGVPSYEALLVELAGLWIERAPELEDATQPELVAIARAHLVRDERCEAQRALDAALARGGPLESVARAELEALREKLPAATCVP